MDANPDFVPPDRSQSRKKQNAQNAQNYWGYPSGSSWNQTQRPKTPRGGRRGQGRGGQSGQKGKQQGGKGHKSGKGKGTSAPGPAPSDGYAAVPDVGKGLPPEPPWHSTAYNLPSLPPLPPPAAPHPDVQLKATQTLNQLAAVVNKQPDRYDPEVHALLQGAALAEGLTTTEKMYKAMADLGEAREALDAARLGRSQNHIRWRDFLASAVTRWQEYTADFQKQEMEFTTAIDQARACITNAKERFEQCKAALSEDELKGVEDVTDEAMAERAQEQPLGSPIQDGLNTMAANLVTLRTTAEAMVIEEQASNKRPRLEGGVGSGGAHSSAAPLSQVKPPTGNAMEPFANREATPSFQQPDKS